MATGNPANSSPRPTGAGPKFVQGSNPNRLGQKTSRLSTQDRLAFTPVSCEEGRRFKSRTNPQPPDAMAANEPLIPHTVRRPDTNTTFQVLAPRPMSDQEVEDAIRFAIQRRPSDRLMPLEGQTFRILLASE